LLRRELKAIDAGSSKSKFSFLGGDEVPQQNSAAFAVETPYLRQTAKLLRNCCLNADTPGHKHTIREQVTQPRRYQGKQNR